MGGAISSDDAEVKIEQLLDQFYRDPPGYGQLAEFCRVQSVPSPYDALLDHHEHMTVTVESHYGEPVDVAVHRTLGEGTWYSREITLLTHKSRKIVMYGIVLLNIEALDPDVWRQIESQEIPLGRALIEHNVMREVQLVELWRVRAGNNLASLLNTPIGGTLYGRTALIYCDGEPAIELLEIVSPTDSD